MGNASRVTIVEINNPHEDYFTNHVVTMGNLEMVKQRLMLEMWNMNLVRKSLVDLIDIATTGSTGDMFRDEFHTVLGYMKNLSPLTNRCLQSTEKNNFRVRG